jgi:hypothetical protein
MRTGRKPFEFRREDGKRFRVGERIAFRETFEKSRKYTGRTMFGRVVYVLRGFPVPEGFVAMTIDLDPTLVDYHGTKGADSK